MNREEILQASRNENRNKDLAELEVVYQAGIHAARVGALVCCMVSVLSSALAHAILYSPWVIYFLCIALDKSFEELFYFWEAAMDNVLLLIFGIFLSVLGILNIKGNISTIHSYNRRKVKEEDIPKYGKAVGTGTVIMGASLILAYFATFWNEAAIDYIIFPAITIGLAFILYGQIKYNHGIF